MRSENLLKDFQTKIDTFNSKAITCIDYDELSQEIKSVINRCAKWRKKHAFFVLRKKPHERKLRMYIVVDERRIHVGNILRREIKIVSPKMFQQEYMIERYSNEDVERPKYQLISFHSSA